MRFTGIKHFRLMFLIFFLLESVALSQNTEVEILGVHVEGQETVDDIYIKLESGLNSGKLISREDIKSAIKKLWQLNVFSDIEIIFDKELDHGIFLTIKVKEYPRLNKVTITGNKEIKRKEIDNFIDLYKGQRISPKIVKHSIANLIHLYRWIGFLEVEVTNKQTQDDVTNSLEIKINIREGKKANKININKYRSAKNKRPFNNRHDILNSFIISGNKKIRKQEIIAALERVGWGEKKKINNYRITVESARDTLLSFYKWYGYMNSEIEIEQQWDNKKPNHLEVKFKINEEEKVSNSELSLYRQHIRKPGYITKEYNYPGLLSKIHNKDFIKSIVPSPDGRFLLITIKGSAKLIDVHNGNVIRLFKSINTTCFSPCSRYILTAKEDGSITLWTTLLNFEIKTIKSSLKNIHSVCFLAEGRNIILK